MSLVASRDPLAASTHHCAQPATIVDAGARVDDLSSLRWPSSRGVRTHAKLRAYRGGGRHRIGRRRESTQSPAAATFARHQRRETEGDEGGSEHTMLRVRACGETSKAALQVVWRKMVECSDAVHKIERQPVGGKAQALVRKGRRPNFGNVSHEPRQRSVRSRSAVLPREADALSRGIEPEDAGSAAAQEGHVR